MNSPRSLHLLFVFVALALPDLALATQGSQRAGTASRVRLSDAEYLVTRGPAEIPRRLLRVGPGVEPSSPLAATERSRRFLTANRRLLFGRDDVEVGADATSPSRLSVRLEHVRRSPQSTHVWQRQYVDGVPVLRAWVQINLDARGRVSSVHNGFSEFLKLPSTRPSITSDSALAAARISIDRPGTSRTAPRVELVIATIEGKPRLVYRTMLALWSPYGDWESLVDAHTAEVLDTRDRVIYCKGHPGKRIDIDPQFEPAPAPTASEANSFVVAKAIGSGYVLPANPLNGHPERSSMRDGDDVDPFRQTEAIDRLDGSGLLRGEHADVMKNVSDPDRANETLLNFFYSAQEVEGKFHHVNVYWHIDEFQQYIQSDLGIDNANNRSTLAYAHSGSADNSFYSPAQRSISFGDGGVDDAEDGEIVLHEYGHAIHDNIIPDWSHTGMTGSIGEAFGDYIAASFGDNPTVGEWDATAYACPPSGPCDSYLRRTDLPNSYPADFDAGSGFNKIYTNSAIISGMWWDVHEALGQIEADRLVIASFFYMPFNPDFFDASNAIVEADRALNGGANVPTLSQILAARGLPPTNVALVAGGLVAEMDGRQVTLHWSTYDVAGVDAFFLERSVDGAAHAPVSQTRLPAELGVMQVVDSAVGLRAGQQLAYRLVAVLRGGDEEVLAGTTVLMTYAPPQPIQYVLEQNYPNPFNPTTRIRFVLPASGRTSLLIFDIQGRLVRTLVDGPLEARPHEFVWDGRDGTGRLVASGRYTYRLRSGTYQQSRAMILLK